MKPGELLFPGTRVKIFNAQLYRDDISTPLNMTMQEATVVAWYGMWNWNHRWTYPSLIDVLFDGDNRISRGYFTDTIEIL